MAAKPVAHEGDVTATAGKSPYTGATSGTWTAGAVTATNAPLAASDGKKVIVQAECTFTFSGTNGTSTVTGTSKVALAPGSRLLTIDGSMPLVDGDSQQDSYGNTLAAASAATLSTG